MVQTIGYLCEQLKEERLDQGAAPRGRSPGGFNGGGRGRSTSAGRQGARGPAPALPGN